MKIYKITLSLTVVIPLLSFAWFKSNVKEFAQITVNNSVTIRFYNYKEHQPRIGRLGGNFLGSGIYLDAGRHSGIRSRWLLSGGLGRGPTQKRLVNNMLKYSKVRGRTIVLYPWPVSGAPYDKLLISTNGGGQFVARKIDNINSPPFLTDAKNKMLNANIWIPMSLEMHSQRIVLKQKSALKAKFGQYMSPAYLNKTASYYKGQNCDGCEAVLWRQIESNDFGKTWQLTRWGIVDKSRIPKNAVLPLKVKHYFYNLKTKKVEKRKQGQLYSLGRKHQYFDPRTGWIEPCPIKGQPVSANDTTAMCTDPKSIQIDYVKRHIKR